MKKIFTFILLSALFLTPSISRAQVVADPAADLNAAYVAALQQVIALLQQEVSILVSQLQTLTDQQSKITDTQKGIVDVLGEIQAKAAATSTPPADVPPVIAGNEPPVIPFSVSQFKFENSPDEIYVRANQEIATTSLSILIGKWSPQEKLSSWVTCVDEFGCLSYGGVSPEELSVEQTYHLNDNGVQVYRYHVVGSLAQYVSGDAPFHFEVRINTSTTSDYEWNPKAGVPAAN